MTEIRILFPHIPKTGGTSLLYHFRRQLGDDRILILGPHARAQRFLGCQPQFEELTEKELAPIRVIQGHGVDQSAIPVLGAENLRLLVVLRHPLSLTRSRYNHMYNMMAGRQATLSSEEFKQRDPGDVMCRNLVGSFPEFVDPEAGDDLAEQAISVLKGFDYVLTTENMDRQVVPLSRAMGLDPTLERRRVAESRQELEESDDEILARNRNDLKLFGRCNHVLESDGRSHNALGYDPSIAQRAASRLQAPPPGSVERQRACYEALARGLAGSSQLAAALDWIEEDGGPWPRVDNPDLMHEILKQAWADIRPRMSASNIAHSERVTSKLRRQRKRAAS